MSDGVLRGAYEKRILDEKLNSVLIGLEKLGEKLIELSFVVVC